MKKSDKEKTNIIMACKGSMDYIRNHKSKGIFYCPNFEDKILLVENKTSYKETFFNEWEEFEKYIKRKYK